MNNPHELIHDNITLLSFIVPFNPGLENVFRKVSNTHTHYY